MDSSSAMEHSSDHASEHESDSDDLDDFEAVLDTIRNQELLLP